ncbi:MAG: Hsp20/alpha crystallin family protein [Bacteroidales bacterium]|nr:Hsp20/alpha crystallin family protein [Bacteroidales bacterium]MCF8387424.1 Hsp20/alpha crystallin family protein [Bacteroidales bacterium]MCF8398693.1 Hsp20/alpha crystallin family protein [Bacteroidales bacterium]
MYIVKWRNHPAFRNAFDRFFNESEENENHNCYRPATNIIDNDEAIELDLSVPGLSKKDFQIDVDKDVLSIKYENGKEDSTNYTHREFGNHSFCRSFSLPETVDVEKIKANYKNGILSVTLPKKEEEKKVKKQIEIS